MPSSEVFDKWKSGELHSGSKSGPVVPRTPAGHRRAIAIFMHERANEEETGSADRPKRGKKPTRRRT